MNKGIIGKLKELWSLVSAVALRWYRDRVGDLAASVTFWLLVSLPAFVLSLLSVLGPLNRVISTLFRTQLDEAQLRTEVVDFVERVFTDDSQVIRRAVDSLFDQSNSGLFIFSLAFALWSVSRGFAGLIRALEDIYQVKDRRTWYHARFVAVLLGVGSMLMPISLIILDQMVWSKLPEGTLSHLIRSASGLVGLTLWASIIYHFGPATRSKWKYDLPGAVVAAFGWWGLTLGFTWYIRQASSITSTVGTVLLALTWVWMSAQILLIGGLVNSEYGKRKGVDRERRSWPERVRNGTGELRKIVANGSSESGQPEAGKKHNVGRAVATVSAIGAPGWVRLS